MVNNRFFSRLRRNFAPVLLFIICYSFQAVYPSQSTTIYFYIPETNINNLALLKDQFESYLSKHGNYAFRPFSDQATFEQFVNEDKNAVLLISSWYYGKLNSKHKADPILVGVSRESIRQKYFLCQKIGVEKTKFSKNEKIASASGIEFSREVLRQIISPEYYEEVGFARILLVPKDIDALMAIEFGILASALTTESGLSDFKRTSPDEYKNLSITPSRREWLLPVVAVLNPHDESVLALIMLLNKIAEDPNGNRGMDMIKLDGFKRFDNRDKRILDK